MILAVSGPPSTVRVVDAATTRINVTDPPYNCVADAQIDNLAAATDCTAGLNAAFADGAESGVEVYIPPGEIVATDGFGNPIYGGYKITGALLAQGSVVKIQGSGAAGRIMPNTGSVQAYDWLTVKGPGSSAGYGGYVRNLWLEAYSVHTHGNTNATAKVGVVLDQRIRMELTDVCVHNAAIGFEMLVNCYGSIFTNCSTSSYGGRVGVNVTSGAGNDVKFYDCWLAGDEAAVYISGNNSGFAFRDGQLTAGQNYNSAQDDMGVVVIGKDYRAGTTGGDVTNCTIEGMDVEAFQYVWFLRTYGQVQLTVRDSLLIVMANPAIGVWKGTSTNSSRVRWENIKTVGAFSNATAFDFAGTLGTFAAIDETGTINDGTFNGVTPADYAQRSFLVQSQQLRGRAFLGGGVELLGKLLLRHNESTDAFEKSVNWGSSWAAV